MLGAVVSTEKAEEVLAWLPALSLIEAVSVWLPSARVTMPEAVAAAGVTGTDVPSTDIFNEVRSSAWSSLYWIAYSTAEEPWVDPGVGCKMVMTGGTVSTLKATEAVTCLPDWSAMLATILLAPCWPGTFPPAPVAVTVNSEERSTPLTVTFKVDVLMVMLSL